MKVYAFPVFSENVHIFLYFQSFDPCPPRMKIVPILPFRNDWAIMVLAGVFVTHSNVGLDTVAGSTVYNMFFITALVALLVTSVSHDDGTYIIPSAVPWFI